MDYAIWVDFPINTAIVAFFIIKLREVFRTGIDVALENGMGTFGSDKLDTLAAYSIPVLIVVVPLSFVIEAIYIILKLQGKEPFITEKYAIATIMGKIILIAGAVMASLLL